MLKTMGWMNRQQGCLKGAVDWWPCFRGCATGMWRLILCLGLLGAGLAGCSSKSEEPEAAVPGPTFSGPRYLHGTVGSMAKLRGYQPLLVSGFGLVVGLDGTGSSDVPQFLRRRLINDMSRKGMGNIRLGARQWTPRRTLASRNTAVVSVYGLIPPGATRGTRFDIWVTALAQTQTTSLASGRLFTTDLAVYGTNPGVGFSRPLASGHGDTYISPVLEGSSTQHKYQHFRTAMVLSGGKVLHDRKVQLVLNQPSWSRSRRIADRINEMFPRGMSDRYNTAEAQTDLIIDLHVPRRFASQLEHFFLLIRYLYVQGGMDFEPMQASELAHVIQTYPYEADHVMYAWEALGRTALPPIRRLYADPNLVVRLAALEAGTYLEDGLAVEPLMKLARIDQADVRKRVGRLLVEHPRSAAAGNQIKQLLNDADPQVALATYEALATKRDPLFIQRKLIGSGDEVKFILDLVEAQRPRVFVRQGHFPRVVIFNSFSGFKLPMVVSLWDGRLMIKAMSKDKPLEVYYRKKVLDDAPVQEGRIFQVAPTVANLVFLLGHEPTPENPTLGLGMTYTQVAEALYQMDQQGKLANPLYFQENALAIKIAQARQLDRQTVRPELDRPLENTSGEMEGGSGRNDFPPSPNTITPPGEQEGMGAMPLP